jgi:hypothetical protein
MHYELLRRSVEDEDYPGVYPLVDALAEAATEVRVEGPVTLSAETETKNQSSRESGWGAEVALGPKSVPKASAHSKTSHAVSAAEKSRIERSGKELPRLLFGRLGKALDAIGSEIAPRRVWLLLDEWSSIPIDLQPFLADMLRRTVFPTNGFTVKVGAIERRSSFIIRSDAASYIGLEPGADTAAALNLDEYLLANEDVGRTKVFFAKLLVQHISVMA